MKVQRVILILCATFLMSPGILFAQENTEKTNPLAGVWQQVITTDDGLFTTTQYAPFFKILGGDGRFYNLISTIGRGYYTQEGTYVITSDSTYTEHITKSPYPGYTDVTSTLKYRLEKDNQILYVEWSTDSESWTSETWVRVGVPE